MGSIERLLKSLENLKVFQTEPDDPKKKIEILSTKDKILNCNTLSECLCAANVRSTAEFPKYLGVVVETLLTLANDGESDVRMVADECLNRITKVLSETNLGRLQVEFYKELKKNGPSRCIRSALWRFAELCPLTRPQKRRAYAMSLQPCLAKLAERHEEALQESLATAMANICPTLMPFATDQEIKAYMLPFLANLCSTSAVVRRIAAVCITLVCQYSRKPLIFFDWLLIQVLDMVLPVMHSLLPECVPVTLGALHCIRLVIPLLSDEQVLGKQQQQQRIEPEVKVERNIMIFELILHCLQQTHPSIMTSALECFQQVLRTPLPGFAHLLLTPGAISSSVLACAYEETMSARETVYGATTPVDAGLYDKESLAPLDEQTVSLSITAEGGVERASELTDQAVPAIHDPANERTLLLPEQQEAMAVELAIDALAVNSSNSISSQTTTNLVDPSPPKQETSTLPPDSPDSSRPIGSDIGLLTAPNAVPILHSVRLICSTFLLTSEGLYPDCQVRVSIKALALSCLSYIVRWYPQAIRMPLFPGASESKQLISDVLLYRHHADPQLQGNVALVVGNILHSIISDDLSELDQFESRSNRFTSLSASCSNIQDQVEEYITILEALLESGNSIIVRMALSALRSCMDTLILSEFCFHMLRLTRKVLPFRDDNYWLVKVELLDMLSQLDILSLVRLQQDGNTMQDLILHETVIYLLGDCDARVRQAAAVTLVQLVPKLFYQSDYPLHNIAVASGYREISEHLYPLLPHFPMELPPLVHGLAAPYHPELRDSRDRTAQSALSRVIFLLLDVFSSTSNSSLKLGICHAFFQMCHSYPVTTFPYAWGCAAGRSCMTPSTSERLNNITSLSLRTLEEMHLGSGGGPLHLFISLLTFSPLTLDLTVHQEVLQIVGNLMAGSCLSALKTSQAVQSEKSWPGLYDRLLVPAADKLLTHLMRLLNICCHILEETTPIPAANPKAVLDAITSPLKKRVGGKVDTPPVDAPQPEPKNNKEAEKVIRARKEVLGTFHQISFYMKLYESIKGAHLNYKVTLAIGKADKFSSFVSSVLTVLNQVLEVASLNEMGKCAEEVLDYLKVVVGVDPEGTVAAVQQLLKALFGANLASQYEELVTKAVVSRQEAEVAPTSINAKAGLFSVCLAGPYADLVQCLAHNHLRADSEDINNPMFVVRKRLERKQPAVLKPSSKVDKNTIAAYIRMFEPLAIKALKMYTTSSSVTLQGEVLALLVQLIQLRVNYCLLDNDQVFLAFILKQIDLISEGPMHDMAGLIKRVFQLLILLSYEKLHTKTLLTIPRIIQLCDGLMASGQCMRTHALPALEVVVYDIFLCRSSSTSDPSCPDIETQREVVVSMLLRIIHLPEVLVLLVVALHQAMKESEERWKRLSRQVIDMLLPMLSKQQIAIDSMQSFYALHYIFMGVSPSVFRPVDILLKGLFVQPVDVSSRRIVHRWLSSVLVILRVLLHIGKEEVILSRLNELDITFDASHMTDSNDSMKSSAGNVTQPQDLLGSFMFQVINFSVMRLYDDVRCPYLPPDSHKFLRQQLSQLLLCACHMFQSGHFRKVTKHLMEQVQKLSSSVRAYTEQISTHMRAVGLRYPTLMLQWGYLLILLNYGDQAWWRTILGGDRSSDAVRPLNVQIIENGSLAMFCDYVVENLHEAEHMIWLTIDHVQHIIEQMHETPVRDFMSAVYGNSAASGLFIQAVHSYRFHLPPSPSRLRDALVCLRGLHKDQSGPLLVLLVERFLSSPHAGIVRLCESIACRRVEMLMAEDKQLVQGQLLKDDLERIISLLRTSPSTSKLRRLLSLMDKLQQVYYDGPASTEKTTPCHPELTIAADKHMYMDITRNLCSQRDSSPKMCATLLGNLEVADIVSIMDSEAYHIGSLAECLHHGATKSIRTDTGTVIEAQADNSNHASPLLEASEKLLTKLWLTAHAADYGLDLLGSISESMDELSGSQINQKNGDDIIRATTAYLRVRADKLDGMEDSHVQAICQMVYSCMSWWRSEASVKVFKEEQRNGVIHAPTRIHSLFLCMDLLSQVLVNKTICSALAKEDQQVLALIHSVTFILKKCGFCLREGCSPIAQLMTCLSEELLPGRSQLPVPLTQLFRTVIVGLARLPCVNEFARMPPGAFLFSGPQQSDTRPHLREDALHDTTLLREFIKRCNLLGWISRQQFEETWACLLDLLTPVAQVDVDANPEDDIEKIEWMVSALRGITGLLCLNLIRGEAGNTLHALYRHQPRAKPIDWLQNSRMGAKLRQLRLYIVSKLNGSTDIVRGELLCNNLERLDCDINYGQFSINFISTRLGLQASPTLTETANTKSSEMSPLLTDNKNMDVDVKSCLRLLTEVFTYLLSPNTRPRPPLALLNECIKSMVLLSDLFFEASHFEWMLTTLTEFQRVHGIDDEIMNQYIVLGMCKAASIYPMDNSNFERLVKYVELGFKSPHIPSRLAAAQGCLYLLEVKAAPDFQKSLLPVLIESTNKFLESVTHKTVIFSELHSLTNWSLIFYMVEHFSEHIKDAGLLPSILQVACQYISDGEEQCTPRITSAIITGFERLLLVKVLTKSDAASLIKLATDRLSLPIQSQAIAVFGLLITCMYADLDMSERDISDDDVLAQKMELVSILFDRVKKGLPQEAEIITAVLPSLLSDFFSPQDIMNKVIGEFLSEQQPHPMLIARMIFEVFEKQLLTGGESLILDWVLLSVSNFSQRSPLSMALWSLSCFFVSASSNDWLRGLFPFVCSRMGILEDVDEQIFLMSSVDFCSRLKTETQQKSFVAAYQSAARSERVYRSALDMMICSTSGTSVISGSSSSSIE